MSKKIKIKPGQKIQIILTVKERELILNCFIIEQELIDILINASVSGNMVSTQCTLDELDELLGYIAAEANHTNDKKLQNELDRLYDNLENIINLYDDVEG